MKFSDQLEQRFATMVTHYPTKRSVLVPMLLYIQDELGAVTDEAIHEIAQRTELTDLEVRNVISYYSFCAGPTTFSNIAKRSWVSATRNRLPTGCSIWRRSSASAHAPGRRR